MNSYYNHGQCDVRPTVTFPATAHHRPFTGTKLQWLVPEARVWTTCPMLLTESGTVGSRSLRQESNARTFEIWAVHSCLCSYGSCKHSSPDVAKFTYFNTQQFKLAHPIHSWSLRMMLQVHCIQNNGKKTKKLNYILKIKPDIFLQHPRILTSRQIIIIIINRFV